MSKRGEVDLLTFEDLKPDWFFDRIALKKKPRIGGETRQPSLSLFCVRQNVAKIVRIFLIPTSRHFTNMTHNRSLSNHSPPVGMFTSFCAFVPVYVYSWPSVCAYVYVYTSPSIYNLACVFSFVCLSLCLCMYIFFCL